MLVHDFHPIFPANIKTQHDSSQQIACINQVLAKPVRCMFGQHPSHCGYRLIHGNFESPRVNNELLVDVNRPAVVIQT